MERRAVTGRHAVQGTKSETHGARTIGLRAQCPHPGGELLPWVLAAKASVSLGQPGLRVLGQ